MSDDPLWPNRLAEERNNVHPLRIDRRRLVEDDIERVWHSVQVVGHLPGGRSRGCHRLPEFTVRRPNVVGYWIDKDLVVVDVAIRLCAKDPSVDVREVRQDQEVLNGPRRRDVDTDGAGMHEAPVSRVDGVLGFDRTAWVPSATVTQAELDEIARISREVYGFEPGRTASEAFDFEDEKYLLKADWYINDAHRLSATYMYNDSFNFTPSDGDLDEFEFDKHFYLSLIHI